MIDIDDRLYCDGIFFLSLHHHEIFSTEHYQFNSVTFFWLRPFNASLRMHCMLIQLSPEQPILVVSWMEISVSKSITCKSKRYTEETNQQEAEEFCSTGYKITK